MFTRSHTSAGHVTRSTSSWSVLVDQQLGIGGNRFISRRTNLNLLVNVSLTLPVEVDLSFQVLSC